MALYPSHLVRPSSAENLVGQALGDKEQVTGGGGGGVRSLPLGQSALRALSGFWMGPRKETAKSTRGLALAGSTPQPSSLLPGSRPGEPLPPELETSGSSEPAAVPAPHWKSDQSPRSAHRKSARSSRWRTGRKKQPLSHHHQP